MRIPKKYGERTLHFSEVQEEKIKYIFIYEGQETEVQYFQGVIDNRIELGVNDLIDLQPVLRGVLQITNSYPLKILNYIEQHLEHYHTVQVIVNKIVDYCAENLEIDDKSIYNIKTLYKDVLDYICNKYGLQEESEFELDKEKLDDLGKYLEGIEIDILEQIDNIQKYIDSQEIVYNKDIDKIFLIIDRDKGNVKDGQYDLIREKCNEKNIQLYVSNPTFEFWLLLHSEKVLELNRDTMLQNKRQGKKRYLEKELSDIFGGYKKDHIKFERFLPYIDLAIEQEKNFSEEINELKDNLGSNVGVLLSELKK